jgi:hypothetical protein
LFWRNSSSDFSIQRKSKIPVVNPARNPNSVPRMKLIVLTPEIRLDNCAGLFPSLPFFGFQDEPATPQRSNRQRRRSAELE